MRNDEFTGNAKGKDIDIIRLLCKDKKMGLICG
jgi:hypothetical protein